MKTSRIILARVFLCILIPLLSIACGVNDVGNSNAPAQTKDILAEEERIRSTLTEMWDAIEKGDIDRYASYVHPDFTQFGENARVLRVGKAAEVKAIKEWIEEPTSVKTWMDEPRVTIRGQTAWITYYWRDKGESKGEPFATRGKSTRIFVKEAGKWLCIHGHYTLLEDK